MGESEEEPKNLLMKVKEESEKSGLKLNIHKAKIMASSPITSQQIDEEKMETVRNFILGAPGGSEVKVSAWNVGDPGSIPGLGRSPGEGNGNPLQYACLENPMGLQRIGHDWATSLTHSKLLQTVTAAMKLKDICSLEENLSST